MHLTRKILPLLPPSNQVRTADEQADADKKGVSEFVDFIRYALLGFGGIALFVGAFVIFNTLSITVAQRTRELATLRTLGATRPQVLRTVVVEALFVGLVASLVGIAAGRRARDGAHVALLGGGPRPAACRHGVRGADADRRAHARPGRDARRLAPARAPRDPRLADRGGPGGCDAAQGSTGAVRVPGLDRARRPRGDDARLRPLLGCEPRARGSSGSFSERWRCSSAWQWCRRDS